MMTLAVTAQNRFAQEYCILVPTYQSSATLAKLIKRLIGTVPNMPIIIVDDGSTDETQKIVSDYENVVYLKHNHNLGKGAALRTGIARAITMEFKYVICLDADLQHDPLCLPHFIRLQKSGGLDLVLGRRRFSCATMPLHRILSNTITSFLISIRTGRRVHDSQCGYRLIKCSNLSLQHFKENGFQFESEFLIKTLTGNMRYGEQSIPTVYNNSPSSINNLLDTGRFIHLFLRSYLWT